MSTKNLHSIASKTLLVFTKTLLTFLFATFKSASWSDKAFRKFGLSTTQSRNSRGLNTGIAHKCTRPSNRKSARSYNLKTGKFKHFWTPSLSSQFLGVCAWRIVMGYWLSRDFWRITTDSAMIVDRKFLM